MTKKILLADDSITIQKVVRITLADGDYNLITVDNGNEALAKIISEKPDLVLLDVVMPGKNGYQVCEEVKKNPETAQIPVILLAGSFEGFDEMKGAEIGADGYIIKPFESQILISKVEEMLSRPKAKRGLEEQPSPELAQMKTIPQAELRKAPEPSAPSEVSAEVKDFMESLSSEMDKPSPPEKIEEALVAPEAEPESAVEGIVEPAREAEQLWGEAEVVSEEEAGGEVMEAEVVSEEQLWEVPPMEGEELAVSEPVEQGEAITGEPVLEQAPLGEEAVIEPEVVAQAEPSAKAELFEPIAEVEPEAKELVESYPTPEAELRVEQGVSEPELIAEPAPAEEPLPGEMLGEPVKEAEGMMEAEPIPAVAETEMLGEEAVPEAPAELSPEPSEMNIKERAKEAAEEIASALQAGLSHEELINLIRDTVERVAWEVVPEMAEALIKERIARWEAQTQ